MADFPAAGDAEAAATEFSRIHGAGKKGIPDDVPDAALPLDVVQDGRVAAIELVRQCGFAASNSEARRLIAEKGVRINGEPASEFDLSAGIAGAYNIPVVMIAGDDVAVAQAKERVPGIEVAMVKRAIHRTARAPTWERPRGFACQIGAGQRFRGREWRVAVTDPATVTGSVTWESSGMTEAGAVMPRVERVDAVISEYRCDDFLEAFQALTAMVMLAGTVR